MGIVRFALRYQHTFYVLALLMVFLGGSAIIATPKDIFPSINTPVVTVIWQYTGLTPEEMDQRVTTYSEYAISTSVGNVRNIESQTLSGISVEKIFFQPNVNVDLAISQIVSATNFIRALMPAGIQSPVIVQFNASSVPVLQLSLSSDRLNEQQLYDYGIYQMRQALAPIPGITLPTPYGGKYRQIMVDLDPDGLRAHGITPNDVLNAVNAQSLTLPSGDAKLGDKQFIVKVNALADSIGALNQLPIKQVGGTTVYLSDVAHVRDGWAVQQNIVHAEGKRSVLLTIIKNGDASTLDVVNRVKAALPEIQKAAPPGLHIDLMFDQSMFVQNAISAVLREGAIAAGLTALMILIFLGLMAVNTCGDGVNPAVDSDIAGSPVGARRNYQHDDAGRACARRRHPGGRQHGDDREHASSAGRGHTVRLRRVGGLGRHRGANADFHSSDLLCVRLRLLPAGRGTLSVYATRDGRRLCDACLVCDLPHADADHDPFAVAYGAWTTRRPAGALGRFHTAFNARFERFRDFYGWLLAGILRHRITTPAVAATLVAGAAVLAVFVGTDFFPRVDAGLIQLHIRAPARLRIERTEQIFAAIEDDIRRQLPAKDLRLMLDNIGLPQRTYNFAFTDGSTIGVNDGVIQIELAEGHQPTARIIQTLRQRLAADFPDVLFYFQPADLVTQVLNFGVPTQVDVQVQGRDRENNKRIAALLRQQIGDIPGIVDAHVQQELDAPEMSYTIDRTRAQELGLNMQEVANDLNISLSSSEQVSPNFWTDPKNGIPYYFAVQTPEYRISDKTQLDNTPVASSTDTTARRSPTCWVTSPPPNVSPCSPSTISPTSRRSTTSMAASSIATSAALPLTSRKSSMQFHRSSSLATTSSCVARSKACTRRSTT